MADESYSRYYSSGPSATEEFRNVLLDRLFRRMYLVCTLMGMLFSDWEESHARNRQWWKTPDG
jgi:hypothetical protein